MKEKESPVKINDIEFNPENNSNIHDVSLNLKNLEIEEEEVLKDDVFDDEYDQFLNEEEYQSLFEEHINVKKSNINEIYANPLYFIKKIIYFYHKEIFLDSYFLTLKTPPKENKVKIEKFLSFEANDIKDDKEACLSFDLS